MIISCSSWYENGVVVEFGYRQYKKVQPASIKRLSFLVNRLVATGEYRLRPFLGGSNGIVGWVADEVEDDNHLLV